MIICVDTETVQLDCPGAPGRYYHALRLGCASAVRWEGGAFTRREDFTFERPAEFWEWLGGRLSKERATWLWAHSAGFDLTAMRFWHELELGNYRLTGIESNGHDGADRARDASPKTGLLVTEDPPTIVVAQHRSGAWVKMVDSLNWFPVRLAELGALLGLDKLSMPGDAAELEDWLGYCQRDVDVLLAAVERIYRTVLSADLGALKYTVAGQSLASFRHLSPATLPCIHDDALTRALERACYYGGRAQCHFVGRIEPHGTEGLTNLLAGERSLPAACIAPLTHLDLTGAYPAMMRGRLYPNAWVRTERLCSPAKASDYLRSYCACAEVSLKSDRVAYPIRMEQHVVYGTGSMRTYLAGPELAQALALGHVTHVHLIALYSAVEMFTAWVDHLWALRADAEQKGERLMVKTYKALLNSLHGKYAQGGHGWELHPTRRADHPWGTGAALNPETGKFQVYRSIAGAWQWKGTERDGRDSFPAIAAYVTSYTRLRMSELLAVAGERQVVYEDVDTLHVTEKGLRRLMAQGEVVEHALGKLKVEGTAERACYWGPRHYDFGARQVRAGLSSKAKPIGPDHYEQVRFARLDEVLNGPPPIGPLMWDEEVKLSPAPPRVQVQQDGWTRPLNGDWTIWYTPLGHDAAPGAPLAGNK